MALGGAQLDDALDALLDDLDQMDPTPDRAVERDRTQQIQVTLHRERALLPQDGSCVRRGAAVYKRAVPLPDRGLPHQFCQLCWHRWPLAPHRWHAPTQRAAQALGRSHEVPAGPRRGDHQARANQHHILDDVLGDQRRCLAGSDEQLAGKQH
jgi:hypothetical protein